MARYEGMDDILQRVRDRLGGSEGEPRPTPPQPTPPFPVPIRQRQYLQTVDAAQAVLQSAEMLKELLSIEYVETLTPEQHEHMITTLGKIFHELWSIEGALQRRAPYD